MAKVQSLDDIFGKTRKSTRSSRKPVFEETAEAAANFREKFAAATQTVKKVEEPHLMDTKVAKNMSSNPPQSHAPPPTRLADKPLASRPEAGPSNTRSPEQPSYLRPRAPLKTREEVEAAELIGEARGLMGLGEHLEVRALRRGWHLPHLGSCVLSPSTSRYRGLPDERTPPLPSSDLGPSCLLSRQMLMRDPELDPSYLKAQRRREARDRAQEIKLVGVPQLRTHQLRGRRAEIFRTVQGA